jgi:hypothetical protein
MPVKTPRKLRQPAEVLGAGLPSRKPLSLAGSDPVLRLRGLAGPPNSALSTSGVRIPCVSACGLDISS